MRRVAHSTGLDHDGDGTSGGSGTTLTVNGQPINAVVLDTFTIGGAEQNNAINSLVTAKALEDFLETFKQGLVMLTAGSAGPSVRVGVINPTTPSSVNVPSCVAVRNLIRDNTVALTGASAVAAGNNKAVSGATVYTYLQTALNTKLTLPSGTPTLNQVIEWNGSAWAFANQSGGGSVSLSNITDWPTAVSATEVGYIDGVTSNVQTQLNTKMTNAQTVSLIAANTTNITGASVVAPGNNKPVKGSAVYDFVTVEYRLITDNVYAALHYTPQTAWPTNVTTTEVSYLDGVTSAIQSQLNTKMTNTQTVSLIAANTTDLTGASAVASGNNKPVTGDTVFTALSSKLTIPPGTPTSNQVIAWNGTAWAFANQAATFGNTSNFNTANSPYPLLRTDAQSGQWHIVTIININDTLNNPWTGSSPHTTNIGAPSVLKPLSVVSQNATGTDLIIKFEVIMTSGATHHFFYKNAILSELFDYNRNGTGSNMSIYAFAQDSGTGTVTTMAQLATSWTQFSFQTNHVYQTWNWPFATANTSTAMDFNGSMGLLVHGSHTTGSPLQDNAAQIYSGRINSTGPSSSVGGWEQVRLYYWGE